MPVPRLPVLVASLSVLVLGMPHAYAAETGPVTCKRELKVTLNPPLIFTEQDHTFDEAGVFASCSNGLEGTLEFKGGTFRGSCKGGHAESRGGVIKWNDGTTSVEEADADIVVPPFFTATGKITEGRFAGRSITSKGYLVPKDPQNCLTSGVTDADLLGDWTFE